VIEMSKLFGTRGRLELFRSLRALRMGGTDASSRTISDEDQEQTTTFRSDAHMLTKKRMHEMEACKAMAILESRHDRWKAGGPL